MLKTIVSEEANQSYNDVDSLVKSEAARHGYKKLCKFDLPRDRKSGVNMLARLDAVLTDAIESFKEHISCRKIKHFVSFSEMCALFMPAIQLRNREQKIS